MKTLETFDHDGIREQILGEFNVAVNIPHIAGFHGLLVITESEVYVVPVNKNGVVDAAGDPLHKPLSFTADEVDGFGLIGVTGIIISLKNGLRIRLYNVFRPERRQIVSLLGSVMKGRE